ncbi:MAG TPA: hypothetical protein DD738_14290 [Ruminiclostridium sp.]|jgi:DNA-binding MarR family transcriptional regulator|nr:hypothetical protein [Ruminiclostridium sp.]
MNHIDIVKRFELLFLKRRIFLQKSISEIGLYPGQPPILKYIANHDHCSQVEIAKALQLSPASVAISTKRLQKAGMLTKMVDETNLRSKKLTITPKGREKTEACHRLFREFDEKMFAHFDESELAQLKAFLDKLINNISEEPEKIDNYRFGHILALENELKGNHKHTRKEVK